MRGLVHDAAVCLGTLAAAFLCVQAFAQDTAAAVGAATGGAAPGGIFLRTRTPSLAPVKNLRYDATAKSISTDEWVYPLPVSPPAVAEIFRLVAKQDSLGKV